MSTKLSKSESKHESKFTKNYCRYFFTNFKYFDNGNEYNKTLFSQIGFQLAEFMSGQSLQTIGKITKPLSMF